MSSSRIVTRRTALTTLAGVTAVACDSARPREGFLGSMQRWNDRAQRWFLHDGSHAPAYVAADETPLANMLLQARSARIYDGPDEVHRMVVARRILKSFERGDGWQFT